MEVVQLLVGPSRFRHLAIRPGHLRYKGPCHNIVQTRWLQSQRVYDYYGGVDYKVGLWHARNIKKWDSCFVTFAFQKVLQLLHN